MHDYTQLYLQLYKMRNADSDPVKTIFKNYYGLQSKLMTKKTGFGCQTILVMILN